MAESFSANAQLLVLFAQMKVDDVRAQLQARRIDFAGITGKSELKQCLLVDQGEKLGHSSASESHAVAEGSVLDLVVGSTTEATSHVAVGSVRGRGKGRGRGRGSDRGKGRGRGRGSGGK